MNVDVFIHFDEGNRLANRCWKWSWSANKAAAGSTDSYKRKTSGARQVISLRSSILYRSHVNIIHLGLDLICSFRRWRELKRNKNQCWKKYLQINRWFLFSYAFLFYMLVIAGWKIEWKTLSRKPRVFHIQQYCLLTWKCFTNLKICCLPLILVHHSSLRIR